MSVVEAVHASRGATHRVVNQVPEPGDIDLFSSNRSLVEALARHGGSSLLAPASALGCRWGTREVAEHARLANEHPPRLRTFDAVGNRIDEVEFHPSWHELMRAHRRDGLHCLPWEAVPHGHTLRAAMYATATQVEQGVGCPTTMTMAAVAALRRDAGLAVSWERRLLDRGYDPKLGAGKASVVCGMAMTEKQGGSDVQANETRAVPAGSDGEYLITGHKWFCLAPMSDVFLMLARTGESLSCFVVPRVLDDGTRNAIALQRLKDKLGNRSNASAEIELDGAHGFLLGEPGRGVTAILEMVALTRLDCVIGSAGIMRAAVARALWHCSHREAFGTPLVDQPLMANVLADLSLESEAATALAMRLAEAHDQSAAGDRQARALKRIGTALGKFWVCKRSSGVTAEALECLGGNGYVEESGLPRLHREAPLNSVWEGAGNVNALDVLRAIAREPPVLEALRDELQEADGAHPDLDAARERALAELAAGDLETRARRIVGQLATVWQATLLVQHTPAAVSDAFIGSRLAEPGHVFGALAPNPGSHRQIIDRNLPIA